MSRPELPWFDQAEHRLRFGWGPNGLRQLAPGASVVVIVDVLSFSTSVDVAVARGAVILPYRWHDGSEARYAADNDALLAHRKAKPGGDGGAASRVDGAPGYSLRPSSLTGIEAGVRLVLPSPNGSALTFGAADAAGPVDGDAAGRHVLVGCLRNAGAVGRAATALAEVGGGAVAVIAAGERWRGTTGPLRPAVEDLLGAGAILHAAAVSIGVEQLSPEASAAVAASRDAAPDLLARLTACGSGRELIERGLPADVDLAAALDTSRSVPTLLGAELVDRS